MRFLTSAAAAALLSLSPAFAQDDRGDWPSSVTIGTASQGGTYFIYGTGLAGMITQNLGLNASAEVTGGPVQNATLVETGDHQIGLVTMGPAYEAWTGNSELAPGVEHASLRALFPMYQTPFEAVALQSSGIADVMDMAGKRVSVGPAGGTAATYWPRFFEVLGVEANISYSGANDATSQVKDGLIDAFAFAAGVPISAFAQIAAENPVNIFGFTEEQREQILEALPEVSAFDVPGGLYQGFPEGHGTVAMWNFAVAHEEMPESLAYEITKLVMENNEGMMQIHATAAETLPENVDQNAFLPYHPGAVRYFDEIGVEIPAELR
ncbi:TAXI family TRAP transporter solute-binding subunit [Paracoccus aestuarii]|uniref:TAXI family TRAP transporter solute-binding subunit n=1 Tax=Paracoccus aestuarii TaxID=453842 RepID=A0A418ZQJ6_9RHOB|nr:TAXI family TRAP transporter solute-binding subunit [Paracoccus aestuarii]RJK98524.1 TAXI family TRAP transporter solute-binding subunit [Paracoccus aestuarii]WCQ98213.1 TAXI family TRAP transporter solute-binding subunit [Paracoccus aestuarii]